MRGRVFGRRFKLDLDTAYPAGDGERRTGEEQNGGEDSEQTLHPAISSVDRSL